MLWRLSLALFGFVSIGAGVLSAITLWVLFGFPTEPSKSDGHTLQAQFEARKGEPVGGVGPLQPRDAPPQAIQPRDAPPQALEHAAAAQDRPGAGVTRPSIAFSGAASPAQSDTSRGASGSGSSSPDIAGPKQAPTAKQATTGAGADQPQLVRTEPQDRQPAARQQISTGLTDLRPPAQCNLSLCSATYKSFHAADCTYQPYEGGPRRICELSARSAEAASPISRAATDPRSEAKDSRVAERPAEVPKPATPARAGGQCNIDLCAATYASFHAADCTYQPHGGGPRLMCELSIRAAEAASPSSRAAPDPRSEAKDSRVVENPADIPKPATPARAGGQCNVDLCAATYASFHAADCTYQPHGGGPRQICEQ